ncbi:MAG: hypothetical protein IPL23_30475 [Saprospiraceae bacterium]|nr:hypothetical protein [Saprospiraceae bacterium]
MKSHNTSTAWKTILNQLNIHPKLLLNKAHPDYQNNLRGKEFDHEGWLNVISKFTFDQISNCCKRKSSFTNRNAYRYFQAGLVNFLERENFTFLQGKNVYLDFICVNSKGAL